MAPFEHASSTWLASFTALGVNVHCVADAATTRDRDAAMTRDSDYDILRYRTESEAREAYGSGWWPRVSNTEMNERRRKGDMSQEYRNGELGHGKKGEEKSEEKGEEKGKERRGRLRRMFGRR
jgi:hypothetical protein